jgi:L-iditol 2-dehydrogenase
MNALVLREYSQFVFEPVPDPEPGPGEVRVAVKACGICGSDVHGMDGSTGRRRPPVIMGHEAAGVIEKLGPAVSGWNTGDRVTFDSTIYCGDCVYCRRGEVNLCDRRKVLGVSCEDYRQNGAFAEFVIVPQRILYRLPAGLSFEHGALVEPYAIAVHAVRRSPPALNDSVVVVGAGMIGLALTQALRHAGCGQLIVVDVSNERLELAKRCGATQVLNSAKEDALARINQCTGGKGADIAFEAVGVSPTVDLTLRCLRKGGAATLVGNITPIIDFPLQIAVTRELTILGSCASKGEYPACLDMLARGALEPAPLISATDRLSAGAAWFQRLYKKEPGLLKVVLCP